MKIMNVGPYELHLAVSGGKAGKGKNITSTVQVRKSEMILKQFRFTSGDSESRKRVVKKAVDFIIFHSATSRAP